MNHSSAHGYTVEITLEDFRFIKAFYPEFRRKLGIESNSFIIGWSELMPVVEKIEDMGYYFTIYRWSCTVSEAWKDETRHGISTDSKIKAVYTSVLTFIKWYNNQQSK